MCCAACVFIGPTHIILALFRVLLLHDFGNSSSWQQILSPRLDENKIKADCEQLYVVLKNCDAPDQGARDGESIKTLYRLVFLLSYRHGSKLMAITTTTASYLCHHPMLPVILVEILRDSKNIKVCAYVLDILSKLVLKNAIVGETERKAIRRVFHEPHHFRTLLQALRNMDTRYQVLVDVTDSTDEETTQAHDMQVRFLKIINCLYSRKGQSQISLITEFNVEFIGRHFVKHAMSNMEISRCMLPLIKTFCRNKKNCELICDQAFVLAFVTLVPAVKRYPAGISILRFLSRSPEAMAELCQSEAVHHFVVQTAIHHAEKSTHRKYLMSTMYRLAKSSYGMQLLKNTSLWLSLLEFFMKSDRLEELRQRMSFTRAYTILHRGVTNKFVMATPLLIDFDLPGDIQAYICDRANHHSSDDSDNDEEEEEDELRNARSRTVSAENEDDDNDDSDNDNDEEGEEDERMETKEEDDKDNEMQTENHHDVNDEKNFQQFFAEFNDFHENNQQGCELFKSKIHRHALIDRLALPDLLPHLENDNDGYLTADINHYSTDQLYSKIVSMKNNLATFQPVVIYDLDELITQNQHQDVNIPNIEDIHMNYLNAECDMMSTEVLHFESRFECGNLRKVEQIGEYEYNLFISPDANMACGLQWFYFQVSGMRALATYAFNIVNLQKCNSQFSYGLQPVMFSVLSYALNSRGWRKCGSELMYYGNEYICSESNKQYRTLRFCITFEYNGDVCYFAYHYPYTYTRLMHVALASFTLPNDNVYVRVEELTKSVGGFNTVPLITITARNTEKTQFEERKLVFLTSRVHPGESNASWIIEGAMRFLLTDEETAQCARENYIFKIIPILNPEGVIYGKRCRKQCLLSIPT
ncbi:uncharacterized protein [Atheta coriaria]|uniref:uncharacterized protein isoform X3 n=1 Tax=Dalotia coriaria TaxID=877792 RepID=UPI0031F4584B